LVVGIKMIFLLLIFTFCFDDAETSSGSCSKS
jgi:hypothetical protein